VAQHWTGLDNATSGRTAAAPAVVRWLLLRLALRACPRHRTRRRSHRGKDLRRARDPPASAVPRPRENGSIEARWSPSSSSPKAGTAAHASEAAAAVRAAGGSRTEIDTLVISAGSWSAAAHSPDGALRSVLGCARIGHAMGHGRVGVRKPSAARRCAKVAISRHIGALVGAQAHTISRHVLEQAECDAPATSGSSVHAGFRAKDGETRTRTGDTTIFSRYVLAAEPREIPGNGWFLRVGLAPLIFAISAGLHAFQGMAGLPSPFCPRGLLRR
jgi:hypothetical protein